MQSGCRPRRRSGCGIGVIEDESFASKSIRIKGSRSDLLKVRGGT